MNIIDQCKLAVRSIFDAMYIVLCLHVQVHLASCDVASMLFVVELPACFGV